MKSYLVGLLCLALVSANYAETPTSASNEAQWAEFVAGVLNVEDEGVEFIARW